MPRIQTDAIGIPNHKLQKNLKLDGKYISNDGGDEGIYISDVGIVSIRSTGNSDKTILRLHDSQAPEQYTDIRYTDSDDSLGFYRAAGSLSNIAMGETESIAYEGRFDALTSSHSNMSHAINFIPNVKENNNGNSAGKPRMYFSGDEYGTTSPVIGVVNTFATGSGTSRFMELVETYNPTTGSVNYHFLSLKPTINQNQSSGDADGNYTGIFLNVTETAVGGSDNKLMDLQVGGTSKFKVDSAGKTTIVNDLSLTDGTSQIFDFDTANCHLRIFDDADTDGDRDYFDISVGASGATSITTNDDGGAAAHLTLDADGVLNLDAGLTDNDFSGILLKQSGTTFGSLSAHHGASIFLLAENAGSSLDDYFKIKCEANGATTIETADAAAAGANLTFDPDGKTIFKIDDGNDDDVQILRGSTISHSFYSENGAQNLFKIYEPDSTDDYFTIDVQSDGATTILTHDNNAAIAHLTLDPDGDINLNAIADVNIPANIGLTFGDAGEKIEGNGIDLVISSSRYLTLDTAGNIFFDSALGIYEFRDDGDTDDKFKITVVGGTGATTLETVSDAADGHLTLTSDGNTIIKIDDTVANSLQLVRGSTITHGFHSEDGNENTFTMYEADSNNDFFKIQVQENGETYLNTVDAAGATAHLSLNPDGELRLTSTTVASEPFTATDSFTIDKNTTVTSSSILNGLHIDWDQTGIVASGSVQHKALKIDVNSDAPVHSGGLIQETGIDIAMTGTTGGGVGAATTQMGIKMQLAGAGEATHLYMSHTNNADYCSLKVAVDGLTTIKTNDDGGAEADLVLDIDGHMDIKMADNQSLKLWNNSQNFANFGASGGSSSMILYENEGASPNDYCYLATYANGATMLGTVDGAGANANLFLYVDGKIEIDGSALGFDRISYSDAANVTVNFKTGNKAHLDMTGGSISGTLTLQFPSCSGNFVLVIQQDSSARTVAAWATKDSAGNAGYNDGGTAGAIRWAGGSAPDLTDGGNKRDVISFYWDADEEVCYGVASLNF